MAQAPVTRSAYVRALPKLSDAANPIVLDASGITRAIRRLDIEPLRSGGRDKHPAVADVLRPPRARSEPPLRRPPAAY